MYSGGGGNPESGPECGQRGSGRVFVQFSSSLQTTHGQQDRAATARTSTGTCRHRNKHTERQTDSQTQWRI